MGEMTEEERKWFKSLERCLKKMPESVELLVNECYCGERCIKSRLYLMKKGVIYESQREADDLVGYQPDEYSLAELMVTKVAANNHGY